MCFGSCLGMACCCAGSVCCSLLCTPCRAAGVAGKNFAKIGYVVFQLVWIGFTILMMYLMRHAIDYTEYIGLDCPNESGGSKACAGASAIVRLSLALAIFHAVMFGITCLRNNGAAMFHDGCWLAKSLIVLGLTTALLWVPNDPVIIGYMKFARWISIAFLTYQAILMLVVAYTLNATLVNNVAQDGGDAFSCSGIILMSLFGLLTIGNIVWIIYQFKLFGGEGCGGNITLMIITVLLGCVMYGIVILRTRKDASVLTSALVLSYCLYLQWSALSSKDDEHCNPYMNSGANTTMEICIGLFFTFVSLLVISSTNASDDEQNLTTQLAAGVQENENENVQYA